jgi:hypothetical protein
MNTDRERGDKPAPRTTAAEGWEKEAQRVTEKAQRLAASSASQRRASTAKDDDDANDYEAYSAAEYNASRQDDSATTGQMAAEIVALKRMVEMMTVKATEDARLLQQVATQTAASRGAALNTPPAGSVAHRSQVQSTTAAPGAPATGAPAPPPAGSMGSGGGYYNPLAQVQQVRGNPLQHHAKRLQPSELLGKEAAKGSVLEDWLFQIERSIGDDDQHTFNNILGFAKAYWDRSVNTWWTGYTEMQQANGTPVRSWDEVKAALRANYTTMSDEQTACDQLYSLSMKDTETMDEYVARVSELYNRIPRARVATEAAAEHMQRGVKPSRFPLAMVEVTSKQQRERAANAGKGLSFENMRGTLVAAAVREPMHLIAAAAAAAGNQQRYRPQGQSAPRGKVNSLSTEEAGGNDEQSRHSVNAADTKCYRCGGGGHMAHECTKPETRACYKCNEVGHLANRCPNKKGTGTGGAATSATPKNV